MWGGEGLSYSYCGGELVGERLFSLMDGASSRHELRSPYQNEFSRIRPTPTGVVHWRLHGSPQLGVGLGGAQ